MFRESPTAAPVAPKLFITGITRKFVGLLVAVPPAVVTVIGPVVAPNGTITVSVVAVAAVMLAVTLAVALKNFTVSFDFTASKPVPLIVIDVPFVAPG